MEFIIIGLFVLFFSYILLYSLYDIFFKSSENIVEGLSAEEKAESGSNQANDANNKVKERREANPNMTFQNASAQNKKPI
jgi:hypothetical protein